jgi:hypothetical protein
MPLPDAQKKRLRGYLEGKPMTASEIKTVFGDARLTSRATQLMTQDTSGMLGLVRLIHAANAKLKTATVVCGDCSRVYAVNGDAKCKKCGYDNAHQVSIIRQVQQEAEDAREDAREVANGKT